MNTYLKAKVTLPITGSRVEYNGSLTLDRDIMDKLGVDAYEQVFINSKYNTTRLMTYLLPGLRGSKICEANGGAAKFFAKGEVVHLLFFRMLPPGISPIEPIIYEIT